MFPTPCSVLLVGHQEPASLCSSRPDVTFGCELLHRTGHGHLVDSEIKGMENIKNSSRHMPPRYQNQGTHNCSSKVDSHPFRIGEARGPVRSVPLEICEPHTGICRKLTGVASMADEIFQTIMMRQMQSLFQPLPTPHNSAQDPTIPPASFFPTILRR